MSSRWVLAFAQGVVAAATIGSCGRETIELARTSEESQLEAGASPSPDGSPPAFPDAASCASFCATLGAVCDETTGRCRGCNDDGDCGGELTRICDPVRHVCVMCLGNDECGELRDRWLPFPLPNVKAVCDTNTVRCTFGCSSSSDCPLNAACDMARGVCLFCQDDAVCSIDGVPRKCLGGQCVQCRFDADCGGTKCMPFIQRCVECYEPGHCGPGRECNMFSNECVTRP